MIVQPLNDTQYYY